MRNLSGAVFYMKTNVLQNFHICISVPLKSKPTTIVNTEFQIIFHYQINLDKQFFIFREQLPRAAFSKN